MHHSYYLSCQEGVIFLCKVDKKKKKILDCLSYSTFQTSQKQEVPLPILSPIVYKKPKNFSEKQKGFRDGVRLKPEHVASISAVYKGKDGFIWLPTISFEELAASQGSIAPVLV